MGAFKALRPHVPLIVGGLSMLSSKLQDSWCAQLAARDPYIIVRRWEVDSLTFVAQRRRRVYTVLVNGGLFSTGYPVYGLLDTRSLCKFHGCWAIHDMFLCRPCAPTDATIPSLHALTLLELELASVHRARVELGYVTFAICYSTLCGVI